MKALLDNTQIALRDQPTYYDRPLLKEPVWVWSVPAYLYSGGAAGACLALAAATQLLDDNSSLTTRCRWIGFAGVTLGSGFLIYDLGRPERFFNMLRVFRPTSPMNVGSWLLAATGCLSALSVLQIPGTTALRDRAAIGAGILGIPLSGYTGVLLANTALPVWQRAPRSLPALFIASGMASAGALLHFMKFSLHEESIAQRFAIVGQAAELIGMSVLEHEVSDTREVGRPLKEGRSGFLWKTARVLSVASLAFSLWSKKSHRLKTAAGICGTAAALSLRFSLLESGRSSAKDPHRASLAGLLQR